MADVAKEIYLHRGYRYDGELGPKQRGANFEVALNYAESLCRRGKLKEALEVYESCSKATEVPTDKLTYLSHCLLDTVVTNCHPFPSSSPDACACGVCGGVFLHPTTLSCGHTFCRRCVEKDSSGMCRRCGSLLEPTGLETDVVVNGLVEKFWPVQQEAASLRDEGNRLYHQGDLKAALTKYDQSLLMDPDNHLTLSNRSQTLCKLGLPDLALADAEKVVKLRPHWGKGYYRRGAALTAKAHYEAALTSYCICVALDRLPRSLHKSVAKVSKVLHHLLSRKRRHRHCRSPFSTPSPKILRRARYFHCPPLSSPGSDGEESSGEEDYLPPTRLDLPVLLRSVLAEVDRLRSVDDQVKQLVIDQKQVQVADFDCALCCRTLWRPVTTQCGHSYCMECFDRCMDYSSSCPLCIKRLSNYLVNTPKSVNEFLENCMRYFLPRDYLARQAEHASEISECLITPCESFTRIPIFVCTTTFPTVHCPLFIFEPRYRLLVRRCVESGVRRFGIAAPIAHEIGARRFCEYGTMLEIRDWVLLSDGCSILSTVGVGRFRALSHGERDGYDTACVEFLTDTPVCEANLPALEELHSRVYDYARAWVRTLAPQFLEQIFSSFGDMPPLEDDWFRLDDGPSWAWWLLAILPLGPQLQISVLSTSSLDKRLRAIEKTINHIISYPPEQFQTLTQQPSAMCS